MQALGPYAGIALGLWGECSMRHAANNAAGGRNSATEQCSMGFGGYSRCIAAPLKGGGMHN